MITYELISYYNWLAMLGLGCQWQIWILKVKSKFNGQLWG
jgi:hypothetical protein